jgi:TonB family protein
MTSTAIFRAVLLLLLYGALPHVHAQQSSQRPVAQAQSNVQIFGGKIVSQNAVRFVLKDYDNDVWYHIDDQQKASNFLGKYVLITGTFDGLTGAIRVRGIVAATPDQVAAANAERVKQNSEAAKSAAAPPASPAPATRGAPEQNAPAQVPTPHLEPRPPSKSNSPSYAWTETPVTPLRKDTRDSVIRLPEEAVSASSTVAISSRRLVSMPPNSSATQKQPAKNLVVGHLLKRVSPSYPVDAKAQRIEGTVRLHAVIGEDGSIRSVQLVSGEEPLVAAAVNAVREWRYGPTLLEGRRIQVEDDIILVFRLPN